VVFQPSFFRGYVKLRGCVFSLKLAQRLIKGGWKTIVSFSEGPFSGAIVAMFGLGRVPTQTMHSYGQITQNHHTLVLHLSIVSFPQYWIGKGNMSKAN